MAERYAVATGNWSSLATWDGGASLPGAGDTVHANTYTVTINQDITVTKITTRAGTTAAAGGNFVTNAARNITADIEGGTSSCLTSVTNGSVITGNVYGGTSTNCVGITNSGSYTLNGDVYGGSATNARGVNITNGNVTVNGSLNGGSGTHGLWIYGTGTLVINGNVYSNGMVCYLSSSINVTINGDIYGGDTGAYTSAGVQTSGSPGGTVVINGTCYAGDVAPAVDALSTGSFLVKVDAMECAANGMQPCIGRIVANDIQLATYLAYDDDGVTSALLEYPSGGGGGPLVNGGLVS